MAFAKGYAKREETLQHQADALREDRDEAIRTAHRDGLPMSTIAQIMGMSHQRVSQIVRS